HWADRHPAVAVIDDSPQSDVAMPPQQNRGMGRLNRLWKRPDRLEADEFTRERGFGVLPDLLQSLDALAEQPSTSGECGAVILHLFGVPSAAYPEDDSAAGEEVERRDLLRQDDGVSLDH